MQNAKIPFFRILGIDNSIKWNYNVIAPVNRSAAPNSRAKSEDTVSDPI
jgi:hypothetical protein